MTLFSGPAEHAANPPSTWKVEKVADRQWALRTTDGTTLDSFTTKRAATEATQAGTLVSVYEKEARWYAGEPVANWKPWLVVLGERERNDRWQEARREGRTVKLGDTRYMLTPDGKAPGRAFNVLGALWTHRGDFYGQVIEFPGTRARQVIRATGPRLPARAERAALATLKPA